MAKTRKEDALSIVGEDYEDEIDTLEELQHQKADVLDELVIKSEEDSPHTEEQEIILRASLEELGYDEDEIEKARWDYAYKKSLPNSAYAWVETGPGCEKKDGETPQKCRHLPYKDKSGNIDCGHVRAALQAIGGARTGKKMTGVPSKAKQKLRSALKSCQRKKSDIEDAEREAELEQARIEGFNLALDLDAPDTEEVTTMTEKKSEQLDLEKIIEAMKPEEPEEEKSEAEPTDPIDEHTNLLKRIPPAEGSRAQKLEAAEGVLRSLAAHIAAEIDKLTPATTEDIAKSLSSELDAKLRPIADKIAVLEAAVTKPQSDSPESKALKSESFYVSPEDSMLAALGESKEKSRIRELARQGLGLPEDQL